VFFSFTSMEEEMLQAVGTATNKSIPHRGNFCAVSNHIRNARLKLLTLSYFNHTTGRRFLPFGITAISKWFGDYLSLPAQGDLPCKLHFKKSLSQQLRLFCVLQQPLPQSQ